MTRKWPIGRTILARAKANRMITLATLNMRMHPADEAYTFIKLSDGHIELWQGAVGVC
jgi:hypothetical protein